MTTFGHDSSCIHHPTLPSLPHPESAPLVVRGVLPGGLSNSRVDEVSRVNSFRLATETPGPHLPSRLCQKTRTRWWYRTRETGTKGGDTLPPAVGRTIRLSLTLSPTTPGPPNTDRSGTRPPSRYRESGLRTSSIVVDKIKLLCFRTPYTGPFGSRSLLPDSRTREDPRVSPPRPGHRPPPRPGCHPSSFSEGLPLVSWSRSLPETLW